MKKKIVIANTLKTQYRCSLTCASIRTWHSCMRVQWSRLSLGSWWQTIELTDTSPSGRFSRKALPNTIFNIHDCIPTAIYVRLEKILTYQICIITFEWYEVHNIMMPNSMETQWDMNVTGHTTVQHCNQKTSRGVFSRVIRFSVLSTSHNSRMKWFNKKMNKFGTSIWRRMTPENQKFMFLEHMLRLSWKSSTITRDGSAIQHRASNIIGLKIVTR